MNRQNAIDAIMASFNFEKVFLCLRGTDWPWTDRPVELCDLKKTARRLLEGLKKHESAAASGGFSASWDGEEFSLEFSLEGKSADLKTGEIY